MAGDEQLRNTQLAGLRCLLADKGIPFMDQDLQRLVEHGFYNAKLLSAATKDDLEQRVGLKLALAGLLVQEFGASSSQAGFASTSGQAGAGPAAGSEVVSLLKDLVANTNTVAANTSVMVADQLFHKHRYSTSQATQYRDPEFKASLINAYQCQVAAGAPGERPKIRCLLLDESFDSGLVCGSHLFKYCWYMDVYATLGFHNINDTRNGLLLLKPLEEAFDNGFLVFTYDDAEEKFTAHWLGDDKAKIAHFNTYPWKTNEKLSKSAQNVLRERFSDASFKSVVEGRNLVFTTEHRPYKRCLSYQARRAFAAAVGQGRIDPSWADGKELRYHSPAATNIDSYFYSIPPGGADPPVNDWESVAS